MNLPSKLVVYTIRLVSLDYDVARIKRHLQPIQVFLGPPLQPGLHSLLPGMDDTLPARPPGQSPPLLAAGGGHVQLDVVHRVLLELVGGIQHCRVRGEFGQCEKYK